MLIVNWKQITHKTKKYIKDDIEEFNELLEKCTKNDYCGDEMDLFEEKFWNWITGGSMDLLDNEIEG